MPFPTLIAALSKFLPSDAVESISKYHSDYRVSILTCFLNYDMGDGFLPLANKVRLLIFSIFGLQKQKVSRHEMIQRVRHIAGDKLLMAIIKSYRSKVHALTSY